MFQQPELLGELMNYDVKTELLYLEPVMKRYICHFFACSGIILDDNFNICYHYWVNANMPTAIHNNTSHQNKVKNF